ncbi:MAG TPA: PrgI family protein [Patescibacteria group bacterium]
MEQHPVPQQISSYQFHLVGDMTLKQFLQLAGGVVVGIVFYATGLPGIIKWPLILISVAIGGAMAFIPFEERPLEQWFIAFFRSIYSPTIFVWSHQAGTAKIFQDETVVGEVIEAKSTGPKIPFLSNLEDSENKFLSKISSFFTPSSAPTPQVQFHPTPVVQAQPPAPTPQAPVQTSPFGGVPTEGVQAFRPASEVQNVQQAKPSLVIEDKVTTPGVTADIAPLRQSITTQPAMNLPQAAFSTQAAPPSPPTIPNTIVGQVIDPDGKIVEGAILEIRDTLGRPVRALKTNKAGHFLIVTPLMEGRYELITEKDGLLFDSMAFEAQGAIIPPIAIKAKGRQVAPEEVKN